MSRVPRWPDGSGKPMLASTAGDNPAAIVTAGSYAPWFDQTSDPFYAFGSPFATPTYQAGSYGRRNFLIRPPRGVLFINAASYGYTPQTAFDATVIANEAAGPAIAAGLEGTGLEVAYGAASHLFPEVAFGNAHWPDGWDFYNQSGSNSAGLGGAQPAPSLAAIPSGGDPWYSVPGWLAAMTWGLPGDPDLLSGGDLLIFLVAWCDEIRSNNSGVGPYSADEWNTHQAYHKGTYYIGHATEADVAEPTAKFTAHYRRFESLIPRLDRFRCVILRNTDVPYPSHSGSSNAGAAEPIISAHFSDSIASTALGTSLAEYGVELEEITGSVDADFCVDLAREHFGV